MKLSHAEVKVVQIIFGQLVGATKPWFAHDLSQNMTTLEPLLKAINAAETPAEGIKEYQDKCQPFIIEHSRKDEAGQPITTQVKRPNGDTLVNYALEDAAAYAKSVEDITKEYADVLAADVERQKALPEFYNHTVEIDLLPLKYSEAPADILSSEAIRILMKCGILIWDLKRETVQAVEEG